MQDNEYKKNLRLKSINTATAAMNTTMTKVNKAMHLALDSIVVGDFTTASVAMVAAIQLAQEAEDNLIRGALVVNHEFDEQGFKDAADATIPKVREALDAD